MMGVGVNPPKTPITKGSNGIATATLPNICKMPGPPAPFVPAPLPNIGKSGDKPKGYTKKVKVEGNPVAVKGASFGSMGDVASKGTGGGMVSANTHGPCKFIGPGSMDVKFEGKNVHQLSDPMTNNGGGSGSPANSATMMGAMQGAEGGGGEGEGSQECNDAKEEKKKKCGSIPQLKKGNKVIYNYENEKMTNHLKAEEIKNRINGIKDCLAARQLVTDKCFGGITDERHKKPEQHLQNGLKKTVKLMEKIKKTV